MTGKIKNFEELAVTPSRRAALEIAEAGLEAIDTEKVIKENVKLEDGNVVIAGEKLALGGRLLVAGVGKCSGDAALALEQILGDKISDGVIIDIKETPGFKKIRGFSGTHPLPSEQNVAAAGELVKTLSGLTEQDAVIFIISGGGSTLLCLPEEKNCYEERIIIEELMRAGATIQEINALRKHLSLARGGYLAKYAYPARAASLIFSDVPGDDLQFIASGPTVKDETTVEDAEKILAKYNILNKCGLEKCGLTETPKEDKYFENVRNVLVGSNKIALEAMAGKAKELGFAPKICSTCLVGEASATGKNIASELHAAPPKSVLLYGGETTVTVKYPGRGGRNQELVLAAASAIGADELVLALASDGRDNTDFAGAICDTIMKEAATKTGLDPQKYLAENNSYEFFSKTGSYILTGNTGSNVSDLVVAIKSLSGNLQGKRYENQS